MADMFTFTPLHCCSFCKPEVNFGAQDVEYLPLAELLPDGYEHVLCAYNNVDEYKFEATISLQLYTSDELAKWKDAFEKNSKSTYRVKITYPNVGQKVLFKGRYHCHHKGSGKKSKGILTTKSTQCLSEMTLTLLNIPDNYKGKNPHIPEFPASVNLKWTHNHTVSTASALRYRDVGQAAQDKLVGFFKDGLSPSCALNALHKSLEDEPNYVTIVDDRQIVPDIFFVNRLFRKHFESLYGKFKGKVMFDDVLEHLKSLDIKADSHVDRNDLIIALVTPLMERVHRLVPQSGEIVFTDASHGLDRCGARVMMLMTHTPLGGLPLGAILLTSSNVEHIKTGLSMLSKLLGEQAFYGRGKDGPYVFMTDHCEAERKAIKVVCPSSTLLLCAYHVLQAFWKFLWDRKSGVKKDERPHIFNLMKGLLYAVNSVELEEKYNNICQSAVVVAYPAVLEQFRKYWAIKEVWAVALHQDMLVTGSDSNDIVDSCFRTLKDKVLKRQKCFNVVQLLNYMAVFISKFYSRKLLQLIHSPGSARYSFSSKKARAKGAEIAREQINHVEVDTYKVLTHYVDTSIGNCTCYFSSSGTACIHQFAVEHHFGVYYSASMPVLDEAEKLRYLEVATGERSVVSPGHNTTAITDTDSQDDESVGTSDVLENQFQNFQEKFRSVCDQIEQLVKSNPDTLLEPANKFISRLQKRLSVKSTTVETAASFSSTTSSTTTSTTTSSAASFLEDYLR